MLESPSLAQTDIHFTNSTIPDILKGNFDPQKYMPVTSPGHYEVSITGETYTNSVHMTNATPVSSNPRLLSNGNSGGKRVTRTFTAASTLVDTLFHFVVYKN